MKKESERRKFEMVLTFAVLFAALAFVYVGCASAEEPQIEWSKTFGGTGWDVGNSVQQTADGGYIIVGYTGPFGGGRDVYLIKTNGNGSKEWSKTFGRSEEDWGNSVRSADGGYIITGATGRFEFGGDYKIYLTKRDTNGNLEWDKTFGSSGRWNEGRCVQQTSDGGYIITGLLQASWFETFLLKTDEYGNQKWIKIFMTHGSDSEAGGRAVQQTADGGYIVVGTGYSSGVFEEICLIKTDENGTKEWSKTFGGTSKDVGKSVQQTLDGGYIIAGSTKSFGAGSCDVYLIKTNENGDEEWNKTFGGIDWDECSTVLQTADGGYIIAGFTMSFGAGSTDLYLIKTDKNGAEEWSKTFGGTDSDEGRSIQHTSDGGYIITGFTSSFGAGLWDVWLIKVKGEEPTISIFDTEPSENPYPSIMGTHKGKIIPSCNINVSTLYTYQCVGTGGHTESIELYDENDILIANGTWNGYQGDWHNITIHNVTNGGASYVTLLKGHKYNYTIITGSYPQIIHEPSKEVTGGTITCSSFVDANGKGYDDWIPAIRLE